MSNRSLCVDLVEKGIARLGKKRLWMIVYAVRQVHPPTAHGVREVLRDIDIFLTDEQYDFICERYGGEPMNVAAFVADFTSVLTPRRRHVVDLVIQKLAPDGNGMIDFDVLSDAYDAMRHPLVVSRVREPGELCEAFIDGFTYDGTPRRQLSTEELVAYFVGISAKTPSDQDFELYCIRSFSLDRPKFISSPEDVGASAGLQRQSRLLGQEKSHPLYTTTTSEYGKECRMTEFNVKFGRSQKFTKNIPTRTGGATSMNM